MNSKAKKIRRAVVRTAIVIFVGFIAFMLYVSFHCPYTEPSDKVKRSLCMQHMERFLEVTNYFETAHQAADELRECEDWWKHKYNVIVADDSANARFGNTSGSPVIIWSSGPNGINENGQGDDVVPDFCHVKKELNCNSERRNANAR